jgi:hypothetical protein
MNANELADKIEDARNETDFQKWAGQAPDMLRQQQAEIANLKAGLLSHHDIYPVKELTDEEIDQVVDEVWKANPWSDVEGLDINAFARAILRKAQEK